MEGTYASISQPLTWPRIPAPTLWMSSMVIQMAWVLPYLVSHQWIATIIMSSYACLVQPLNTNQPSLISGHFCGNKVPDPVLSSGNEMVVRFKSDSINNAKGFSAVYSVAFTTTTTRPPTSTKPPSTSEPTGESWTHLLNWFLSWSFLTPPPVSYSPCSNSHILINTWIIFILIILLN